MISFLGRVDSFFRCFLFAVIKRFLRILTLLRSGPKHWNECFKLLDNSMSWREWCSREENKSGCRCDLAAKMQPSFVYWRRHVNSIQLNRGGNAYYVSALPFRKTIERKYDIVLFLSQSRLILTSLRLRLAGLINKSKMRNMQIQRPRPWQRLVSVVSTSQVLYNSALEQLKSNFFVFDLSSIHFNFHSIAASAGLASQVQAYDASGLV